MQMEPVQGSSNIKAIGHDPATKVLRVEFRDGKSYNYANVGTAKHAALMASESKGSHLHKHIKSCHECEQHFEECA
jgi:hypothetical protein